MSATDVLAGRFFELRGPTGLRAVVTNVGARLVQLWCPDARGEWADVVLGFDAIEEYERQAALYFGCTVGRVANRTAGARFRLDGVEYRLTANDAPHHLHGGGARSFDKRVWEARPTPARDAVAFHLISPALEEGYPGEVHATVRYALGAETLAIELSASVDRVTPVNLTHHSYWNLRGHDAGVTVLDHELSVRASRYTPVGHGLIPTGEIAYVDGTALDFRSSRRIGERIVELEPTPARGYDHNLVLDPRPPGAAIATLRDPASGRVMQVASTQPGLQVYSGQLLPDVTGKGGAGYGRHGGICLEPQGFPNAVNEPAFPSILAAPGAPYRHVQVYRFSVDAGPATTRRPWIGAMTGAPHSRPRSSRLRRV